MSAGTARASRGERAGLRGLFCSCAGTCQTGGGHMALGIDEAYRGDEAFAFVSYADDDSAAAFVELATRRASEFRC
jgi:hypothetical protein